MSNRQRALELQRKLKERKDKKNITFFRKGRPIAYAGIRIEDKQTLEVVKTLRANYIRMGLNF